MKKKLLLTGLVSSIFSGSLYAATAISGEIETNYYKFPSDTTSDIEANISLDMDLSDNVKAHFAAQSIYGSAVVDEGTELKEYYVQYNGIPNTITLMGKMGIGTEFTDGSDLKGKGIVVASKTPYDVNLTVGHFWKNDKVGIENTELSYFRMDKTFNNSHIETSFLFDESDFSYSEALKTIAISTENNGVKVLARASKTDDVNNDGSFTLQAEKTFKIPSGKSSYDLNVFTSFNKGYLVSSEDINDKDTTVGFGVYGSDVTSVDTEKVLVSLSTKVHENVDVKYSYLHLNGFDSTNTLEVSGPVYDGLTANVKYNHEAEKSEMNLKYSF